MITETIEEIVGSEFWSMRARGTRLGVIGVQRPSSAREFFGAPETEKQGG